MTFPDRCTQSNFEDVFSEVASTSTESLLSVLRKKTVIVYGAGECSHWFHEIIMKRHGCQPVAVLDRSFRNLQGPDFWQGIPAYSPDSYQPPKALQKDAWVVVCVGNRAYHSEIVECLRGIGFVNIVFLHDIYEIHNPFDYPQGAVEQGYVYYKNSREKVLAALELFADEQSRSVYSGFLRTHMYRWPVDIPQSPRHEQYFPADIVLSQGYSSFVCCGAYDGDTLRLLHSKCGKVSSIACFEPEPHIYGRLTDFLEKNGDTLADRIMTWPCAVHDHSGLMPFIPGDGLGSRISPEGVSQVQCVSLDQALVGVAPTFISMDVEGAEPEVLRGAESLLRKHTPDLGVCVYHSPNHAWEIPLYLDSLDVGYRFYLRNYTGFAIETVLYATV